VRTLGTQRPDHLNVNTALPLTGRYYPLGFPLDLATNSRDVIAAADEAWRDSPPQHAAVPLVLHVFVSPDGAPAGCGRHRMHGHLYAVVSDQDNFAHIDLRARFGVIHVSQATASDHSALRWFYLESLPYVILAQRDVVMVHAGCVVRDGRGVLLCGSSTAGKSTLAYACAKAGWTWLSDDCTCLLPDSEDRFAIARTSIARLRLDSTRFFPELDEFAARVRPTGTIGIEVPMDELPGVRTTRRAPIGAIAFLDRGPGEPFIEPLSPEQAFQRFRSDMPSYGPEIDPIHERAVRAVTDKPAFRLRYETIQQGLDLLSQL
jgi:hypothetical protein